MDHATPAAAAVPIERSLLQARLATLRSEYGTGQRLLAEAEARAATLREQLLRIGGAAQVLEELLATADEPVTPAASPAPGDR
ncbi:hypothetical protein [Cupriavidus sp. UYPR2.512]|uniref:hypothetical protein n=1 Tax=Cupriavidus sp. UYPR2.512 TaxID=1080187 RepID=UPI000379D571|nr:hypothetical protein [Cupriavidus sp. UYPR2.512]UIF91184.1 hypothetical protein KAF44_34125 [Cupriavidus necator]